MQCVAATVRYNFARENFFLLIYSSDIFAENAYGGGSSRPELGSRDPDAGKSACWVQLRGECRTEELQAAFARVLAEVDDPQG
jgi:hypothetical protein